MDKSQTHNATLFPFSSEILSVLLFDRTTGKNILWASDGYGGISAKSQIKLEQITGKNADRIKPRVQKQKDELAKRTRSKAEVFTPSWICNAQNNLIDEAWFARKNVFNTQTGKTWKSEKEKIAFSTDIKSGRTWQDYVKLSRLEITCGEAPYLASRYDTVSGKKISLMSRIGLLDRKMRVVCENAANEEEYFLWARTAFENCYGFELQGDNLLLARANLLLSFDEYTKHFLRRKATENEQMEIAEIISWNLWQMDGLTFSTPPVSADESGQGYLFEEFNKTKSFPCKIKDWKENKVVLYKSLLKKQSRLPSQARQWHKLQALQ